jgi:hypothetical protein
MRTAHQSAKSDVIEFFFGFELARTGTRKHEKRMR